jgi:hypothetical protein
MSISGLKQGDVGTAEMKMATPPWGTGIFTRQVRRRRTPGQVDRLRTGEEEPNRPLGDVGGRDGRRVVAIFLMCEIATSIAKIRVELVGPGQSETGPLAFGLAFLAPKLKLGRLLELPLC